MHFSFLNCFGVPKIHGIYYGVIVVGTSIVVLAVAVVVRCFCWRFLRIIILSVVILNLSVTLLLLECFLVDAVEARYHGFQRSFFVLCVFTGHYPGAPNREKAETTTRGLLASEFVFIVMKDRPLSSLYLEERLKCSFTP